MASTTKTWVNNSAPACEDNDLNGFKNENNNLITSSGQSLNTGDNNQSAKAVMDYTLGGDYFIDSGVADAYVLSASNSRKEAPRYVNGMSVRFEAGNTNTGASTVNVSSLGSKDIVTATGSALSGGEIESGKQYTIEYDGTDFRLQEEVGGLPRNYITGLNISNNSTDSDHDIDIATGECRDSANSQDLSLTGAFVKQIDVNWASGSGNGGFPSGLALAADTWYYVFVIAKPDGTTDAGFDTSLSATNLLSDAAGYTKYRKIGWVLTDSSSNIISLEMNEFGNLVDMSYDTVISEINDTGNVSSKTSTQTLTLTVPPGEVLFPKLKITMIGDSSADANIDLMISKQDGTMESRAVGINTEAGVQDNAREGDTYLSFVPTNTSAQIGYRYDIVSGTNISGGRIKILGFKARR